MIKAKKPKDKIIGYDNLAGDPVFEKEEQPNEKIQKEAKAKVEVLKPKMRACGCCKVELDPVAPGQRYFEAPDGHVMLGEEKTTQIWDRRGKGSWINPIR